MISDIPNSVGPVIDEILSNAENTRPQTFGFIQEPNETTKISEAEFAATNRLARNMSTWINDNQQLRDENDQLKNEINDLRIKLAGFEKRHGHESRSDGAEEMVEKDEQVRMGSLGDKRKVVDGPGDEEPQCRERVRRDGRSID
jgi:predicted RNase H-like nuclease (RuvC/YqgF family)